MAVESLDDRLFMLQDFGVAATWAGNSVTGLFDTAYSAEDVGGAVAFAMSQPRFLCRSGDITGMAEGEIITLEGATYYVRVIMPDGTGMTELALELQ